MSEALEAKKQDPKVIALSGLLAVSLIGAAVVFGQLGSVQGQLDESKGKVKQMEHDHQHATESFAGKEGELVKRLHAAEHLVEDLKAEVARQKEGRDQLETLTKQLVVSVPDVYDQSWRQMGPGLVRVYDERPTSLALIKQWEQVADQLKAVPEFAAEEARLRIRIAQAKVSLGQEVAWHELDWGKAGLTSHQEFMKVGMLCHAARVQLQKGNEGKAHVLLRHAKEAVPAGAVGKDLTGEGAYLLSMIGLVEADALFRDQPSQAMKLYLDLLGGLNTDDGSIMRAERARSYLTQICLASASLKAGLGDFRSAASYRRQLAKKVDQLEGDTGRLKGKIEVEQARAAMMEGDLVEVKRRVESAKKCLGEEDVLLAVQLTSLEAELLWSHGDKPGAMKLLNAAEAKLKALEQAGSWEHASLLWLRSSLQDAPEAAIKDALEAVRLLEAIFKEWETTSRQPLLLHVARRQLAMVHGDIAHLAAGHGDEARAKKHFTASKQQWQALLKVWKSSEACREGLRWCEWRLSELK